MSRFPSYEPAKKRVNGVRCDCETHIEKRELHNVNTCIECNQFDLRLWFILYESDVRNIEEKKNMLEARWISTKIKYNLLNRFVAGEKKKNYVDYAIKVTKLIHQVFDTFFFFFFHFFYEILLSEILTTHCIDSFHCLWIKCSIDFKWKHASPVIKEKPSSARVAVSSFNLCVVKICSGHEIDGSFQWFICDTFSILTSSIERKYIFWFAQQKYLDFEYSFTAEEINHKSRCDWLSDFVICQALFFLVAQFRFDNTPSTLSSSLSLSSAVNK